MIIKAVSPQEVESGLINIDMYSVIETINEILIKKYSKKNQLVTIKTDKLLKILKKIGHVPDESRHDHLRMVIDIYRAAGWKVHIESFYQNSSIEIYFFEKEKPKTP